MITIVDIKSFCDLWAAVQSDYKYDSVMSSANDDYIIFPLPKSKYCKTYSCGKCKLLVYPFPYANAAVRSLHKLQGATVDTCVLALRQRPSSLGHITIQGLTVAFSRVKYGDNLGILPMLHDDDFDYLKELQISNELIAFLHAINHTTGFFDLEQAIAHLAALVAEATTVKSSAKKKTNKIQTVKETARATRELVRKQRELQYGIFVPSKPSSLSSSSQATTTKQYKPKNCPEECNTIELQIEYYSRIDMYDMCLDLQKKLHDRDQSQQHPEGIDPDQQESLRQQRLRQQLLEGKQRIESLKQKNFGNNICDVFTTEDELFEYYNDIVNKECIDAAILCMDANREDSKNNNRDRITLHVLHNNAKNIQMAITRYVCIISLLFHSLNAIC